MSMADDDGLHEDWVFTDVEPLVDSLLQQDFEARDTDLSEEAPELLFATALPSPVPSSSSEDASANPAERFECAGSSSEMTGRESSNSSKIGDQTCSCSPAKRNRGRPIWSISLEAEPTAAMKSFLTGSEEFQRSIELMTNTLGITSSGEFNSVEFLNTWKLEMPEAYSVGYLLGLLRVHGMHRIAKWISNQMQFDGSSIWCCPDHYDDVNLCNFVERKNELLKTFQLILQKTTNISTCANLSRIIAICGFGGIGKTEFIKYIVRELNEMFNSNLIWIDAEDQSTMIKSFKALAELHLSIPTFARQIKEIVSDCYQYFWGTKSFFIFDNVSSYEDILEFLPSSSSTPTQANLPFVLITTRRNTWPDHVVCLNLDAMKLAEAVELLKKILQPFLSNAAAIRDESYAELAAELDCFPLAIVQAAAYIRETRDRANLFGGNASNCPIQDYLSQFKSEVSQIAKQQLGYEFWSESRNSYKKSVIVSWKLTWNEILSTQFGVICKIIMRLLAFCAPGGGSLGVPTFLFLDWNNLEPAFTQANILSALRVLKGYSVLRIVNGRIFLHRLLQKVVRVLLKPEEERFILSKMCSIFKPYLDLDLTNAELVTKISSLVPHSLTLCIFFLTKYSDIKIINKEFMNFVISQWETLYALSEYNEALELVTLASEPCKKAFGQESEISIELQDKIGLSYLSQGEVSIAKEHYIQLYSLAAERSLLGKEHRLTLTIGNHLGWAYNRKADFDLSIELYSRIAQTSTEKYGDNDENTIRARCGIANVNKCIGNHELALSILQDLLNRTSENFGDSHQLTMLTKYRLGMTLTDMKNYNAAYKYFKEFADEKIHKFGLNHGSSICAKIDIISALIGLENYEEAEQIIEEIYSIAESRLGRESLSFKFLLEHKAKVESALGKITLDEELATNIDILTEKMGKMVLKGASLLVNVIHSENKIAAILYAQGKLKDAVEKLESVVAKQEIQWGPDHKFTLNKKCQLEKWKLELLNLRESSANSETALMSSGTESDTPAGTSSQHRCTQCHGLYKNEKSLKTHVRKMHRPTGAPKLVCQKCGRYETSEQWKLDRHMYKRTISCDDVTLSGPE